MRSVGMATFTIIGELRRSGWWIGASDDIKNKPGYCVVFEALKSKITCHFQVFGFGLEPGDLVMVTGKIDYAGNNQPYTDDITILLSDAVLTVIAYPETENAATAVLPE